MTDKPETSQPRGAEPEPSRGEAAPALSRHSLGTLQPDRSVGRSSASAPAPSIGRLQRLGAFAAGGSAALGAVVRAGVRRARRGRRLPGWSARTELVVEGMRAFLQTMTARDPALLQATAGGALGGPSAAMRGTRQRGTTLGEVRAEWIEPAEGAGDDAPVVLFLHGGGYVFGSIDSHRDLACRLALAAGSRVALIDYRLAPQHPFPAALNDALAAYRALLDRGIPPTRVVVAGDSAGGGLSLALLLEVRNRGWESPAAAALICPWVDLALTGKSLEHNAETDYLDRAMLATWSNYYRSGEDARHPLVSPLYADLTGLPPLLIHVGAAEILLDDAQALAGRAQDAGVPIELTVWDDMFHDWHGAAALVPEGQRAIDEIGRFVRRRTGAPGSGAAAPG
ncbi:MAG: alpha/beta hydrolase [Myxococcota bacterium]